MKYTLILEQRRDKRWVGKVLNNNLHLEIAEIKELTGIPQTNFQNAVTLLNKRIEKYNIQNEFIHQEYGLKSSKKKSSRRYANAVPDFEMGQPYCKVHHYHVDKDDDWHNPTAIATKVKTPLYFETPPLPVKPLSPSKKKGEAKTTTKKPTNSTLTAKTQKQEPTMNTDETLEVNIKTERKKVIPRKPFTPYGLNGYLVDKAGNIRLHLDRKASSKTITIPPDMFDMLADMVKATLTQGANQ